MKPGEVYHNTRVIGPTANRYRRAVLWACGCLLCGRRFERIGFQVRHVKNGCSRCQDARVKPGDVYNTTRVVGPTGKRYRGTVVWACVCVACGATSERRAGGVRFTRCPCVRPGRRR